MKKLRTLFTFLCLINAANSAVSASIRKGPYLIYQGHNTKMTVLWQADATEISTIRWGRDTKYTIGKATTLEYGSDHQHSFTLTGLQPDTRYFYKVGCCDSGSFLTAPDVNASAVKILVYGDTRSSPARHEQVVAAMRYKYLSDQKYQSLVLHCGDWVDNGDVESDWAAQFFPALYPEIHTFLSGVPIAGAKGNHEQSGALFAKYFPFPYVSDFYWSFDYGPAHIIILDQYVNYSPGSDQYKWLKKDLSKTTKEWKFIVVHEPGWSAGAHQNNSTVQNFIHPLMLQYGVDLLIAGHNHYYAHAEVDHLHHLTVGGGGAPLAQPSSAYPNIIAAEAVNHFLEIAIESNTMAVVARRTDGSVIEAFSVNHSNLPANNPPAADAGPDQAVPDSDNNCRETVRLDGSGTDTDGSIMTYTWSLQGGDTIATGAAPSVDLSIGTHTLTLTVTDDQGLSATDQVVITVAPAPGSSSQIVSTTTKVTSQNDDAEEYQSNGTMYLTSTDLELVYDSTAGRGNQHVGIRFSNVNVPPMAAISDAWLQFTVDETTSGTTNLVIRGEAADNSARFTSAAYNISSRNTTTNALDWNPPPWNTVNESGLSQQTPNLRAIVQEIINRPGWLANNAMTFFINGSGKRSAKSYNRSASNAPQLIINYIQNVCNQTPAVDFFVSKSGNDALGDGSSLNPWLTLAHAIQSVTGTADEPVTIHVAAGTYTENIAMDAYESIEGGWNSAFSKRWDFEHDGITPTQEFKTSIDGSASGPSLSILNLGDSVSLSGLTIQNGFSTWDDGTGGGITISNSSPHIQYCIIKNNTASDASGGGILIKSGNPEISHCIIADNSAGTAEGGGGGLAILSGIPHISSCFFSGNNTFEESSIIGGGAILNKGGNPVIQKSSFMNNTSDGVAGYGGAIANFHGTITLIDTTFTQNRAGARGGALFNNIIFEGDPQSTIINSVFSGNTASDKGGALDLSGVGEIINSTFWGNSAQTGGALYSEESWSSLTVNNTIFWGNTASLGSQVYGVRGSFQFNDIDQDAFTANNNIRLNPQFIDPDNGDFHLLPESPCIDRGDNSADLPVTDFEGDARIIDGNNDGSTTVDMGADEHVFGAFINWNHTPTVSYSVQDMTGAITPNGFEYYLEGNRWRRTVQRFDITSETMLEFDYMSTSKAEIQGIGCDEDDILDNGQRIFQLFGSQLWGGAIQVPQGYTASDLGNWVHFSIPIGQYYTSSMHLVFANDQDASPTTQNSRYKNVRITQSPNPCPTVTISAPLDASSFEETMPVLLSATSMSGANDALAAAIQWSSSKDGFIGSGATVETRTLSAGTHIITACITDNSGCKTCDSITTNIGACLPVSIDFNQTPLESAYPKQDNAGTIRIEDGGTTLYMDGNRWRRTQQSFNIRAATVLDFDYMSTVEAEIQGIGCDEDTILDNGPRLFQLRGSQVWSDAIQLPQGYTSSDSGTWVHFTIPVGHYYTGRMPLVFANDQDASPTNQNSRFKNIRLNGCP